MINQTIGIDYIQIIVIDDASTDSTFDILSAWEKRFPTQFILVQNEYNLKQGAARNTGITYATGKYISFLDADDWIEHFMYEKMIGAAEIYNCQAVQCQHYLDFNHQVIHNNGTTKEGYHVSITKDNRNAFITQNILNCYITTKVYLREFLKLHNILFPEGIALHEDVCFQELVNVYITSAFILDDRLYHCYVSNLSTSRTPNTEVCYDIIQANRYLWNEYHQRNLLNSPHFAALEFKLLYNYWYLELRSLIMRLGTIPYELFCQMKADILTMIPDYKQNQYISQFFDSSNIVYLKLLEIQVTSSDLEDIADKLQVNMTYTALLALK